MRPTLLALALVACSGSPSTDLNADPRAEDPGRVTARRLNRSEYNRTVRDLLFTDLRPADSFPPDDFAHGWDHMADALTLSPLHLELYEQAADALIAQELRNPIVPEGTWFFDANDPELVATTGAAGSTGYMLWSNGSLVGTARLDHPGTYTFTASLAATQAGPDLARAALTIDGANVATFEVTGERRYAEYTTEVELTAGAHTVGVAFLNDYYNPELGEDRNLLVERFQLDGPFGTPDEPTAARSLYYTCAPDSGASCRADILRGFARRAWRRPPSADGLSMLTGLTEGAIALGADPEEAVHTGIKAALLSPRFLFRLELGDDPTAAVSRPLDPYELASRLSYFLWRSMPDEELFELAASEQLLEPEILEQQTRRMLADPRATSLIDDLAGQWLYLRAVDDIEPDYATFPDFDGALRDDMRAELDHFVAEIVLEDRSMLDLLTEEQTWVSARLAEHYGVAPPIEHDQDLGPVYLDEQGRAGLLGKAGLLTALSFPTRTSPVKRGQWVMAHLLCEDPPPAPAEVEGLPEHEGEPLSLRERMERHREDPACATCHKVMDPIGFSMENFDAVGAFRTHNVDGTQIDPSGSWPGGPSFADSADLSFALAEDPRVASCMVRNVFAYALARPAGIEDIPYLDRIDHAFEEGEHRFATLAVSIVLSEPFRRTRGEPEVTP